MILVLLLSMLLGFIIGFEREWSGKAVGIRTAALVTLGSTLFCLMSPTIFGGDNSRIVAAVIQGIGFLGAGVIFKNGDETHGLTTAVTVWASASIGCLVGTGFYMEACIGTVLIVLINLVFKKLRMI